MPFSLKMSKNIKSTTRHSKLSYISIFTNLLRTDPAILKKLNIVLMKIPFQIKHQQFERIINLDINAVAVAQMCYEKIAIPK